MTLSRDAFLHYPFEKGKHGVDFSRLDETSFYEGSTTISGSGRKLHYRFNERGVSVYDPTIFPFNIRGYELASSMLNDKTINFSLFTLWCGIWHHPDMYAGIFVESSVKYFEKNGFEIKSWVDQWYPYSVNYKKYVRNLRAGQSSSEAAATTWSGIQAKKLGFIPDKEIPGSYRDEGARVFQFVRN